MTKYLLAAGASALLVLSLFLPIRSQPPDFGDLARWNSVLIGDGTRDFCSGTIIGGGQDVGGEYSIVLTAAHCTTGKVFTITRKIKAGNDIVIDDTHPAALLGQDVVGDVAILRSYTPNKGECIPVARDFTYTRGTHVYTLSNPMIILYAAVTYGIVSAPVRVLPVSGVPTKVWMADAPTLPGSSGGAALDEWGQLIGVDTGGIQGSSFSFWSPVSAANFLILTLNLEKEVCRG